MKFIVEIKQIIFDLDNTLIDWKDEYWNSLTKAFEELNLSYSKTDINKIIYVVDMYEDGVRKTYNKALMKQLMEKELGYVLPDNFIEIWMKYLEMCVPEKIDETVIKTLSYLKNKYNLVILSNWFEKSQIERLKNAGLYKFFSNTYMTENIPMKPNKEAFEIAVGKYKVNECVMIGDNFKVDIEGAINAGIKAVFINKKNVKVEQNSQIIAIINNIAELMEIF